MCEVLLNRDCIVLFLGECNCQPLQFIVDSSGIFVVPFLLLMFLRATKGDDKEECEVSALLGALPYTHNLGKYIHGKYCEEIAG